MTNLDTDEMNDQTAVSDLLAGRSIGERITVKAMSEHISLVDDIPRSRDKATREITINNTSNALSELTQWIADLSNKNEALAIQVRVLQT